MTSLDFRKQTLKKTTENEANKVVQAIKSILSEAFFRENIKANPGAGIGKLKPSVRGKGVIPKEIISEVFSQSDLFHSEILYMFLKTLAFTGARFSEITALSWGQIKGPICKINRAHKTWGAEIGLPKWDKIREIYLPDSIASMLEYWKEESFHPKDEDLVFCYDDGTRLGNSNPRKRFYQVIEKLIPGRKEQNITAHSLRHSLNTHLLSAGVDPLKVQLYLGWSNTAVRSLTPVQIGYTHLTGHDLRDVAETIDSIYSIK